MVAATEPRVRPAVVGLIGPPNAGKSTALRSLCEVKPGLALFGVRVFFGQQAAARTPIGRRAETLAKQARWLPDEFVGEGFGVWLDQHLESAVGIVIEGLPRSRAQAAVVDRILRHHGLRVELFVYIEVPDHVAAARSACRQVCTACDTFVENGIVVEGVRCEGCGGPLVLRRDDQPEIFAERLAHHRASAREVIAHYGSDRVIRVDGTQPATEVAKALISAVEPVLQR